MTYIVVFFRYMALVAAGAAMMAAFFVALVGPVFLVVETRNLLWILLWLPLMAGLLTIVKWREDRWHD